MQQFAEKRIEPIGDIGILCPIEHCLIEVNITEMLSLGNNIGIVDRLIPEILLCQIVHIEDRGGVQEPRGHHGIEDHTLRLDSPLAEHLVVVLDILSYQRKLFRLKILFQQGLHLVPVQQSFLLVNQGDIVGLAFLKAERKADYLGVHLIEAGGLQVESNRMATLQRRIKQSRESFESGDCLIGGFGLFGFRSNRLALDRACLYSSCPSQLLDDGPHSNLLEDGDGCLIVYILDQVLFGVEGIDGEKITSKHNQALAQLCSLLSLNELLLQARSHQLEIGVDAFQTAELLQELDRTLFSDALDPRNVVGGVSKQRKVVNNLFGKDSVLLCHLSFSEQAVELLVLLGRTQRERMVIHQLQEVLVTGEHDGIDLMAGCLIAEGGDDIIGLKALHFDGGDAKRLQKPPDHRNLLMQLFGSSITVGLVRFVHGMAERGAHAIHRNHQIGGMVFADQLENGGEESIHGTDVLSLGIPDRIGKEAVERSVNQAISVNDIEFLILSQHRWLELLLLRRNRKNLLLCLLLQFLLIKILLGKQLIHPGPLWSMTKYHRPPGRPQATPPAGFGGSIHD
ncbi:hypothetical protein SDC9_96471 [bioreactor metagenome]|uniref:Uncharacterized protein n=1 Tax=bioreactor metagenome TaxID=1076179 RepID=A0A645A993_9ZZZZ